MMQHAERDCSRLAPPPALVQLGASADGPMLESGEMCKWELTDGSLQPAC